jgi:hypothetical protein
LLSDFKGYCHQSLHPNANKPTAKPSYFGKHQNSNTAHKEDKADRDNDLTLNWTGLEDSKTTNKTKRLVA